MDVVILCGGLGTRLREQTEFRPKPMVEIGGRPILWHIIKTYAAHRFRDFILALGYQGNIIKEYFLNYDAMNNDFTIDLGRDGRINYQEMHREQDIRVTLADTGENTMTGGRILRAGKYLEGDTFMATYGDGLSDVDLNRLVAFHNAHGKIATVTIVRPVSRFGVVEIDEDDQVTSFAEKPESKGWVNAGYFVFDRRFLDYIEGDESVLEREPLERVAKDGQLRAYRHTGFFFAMDTYREYQQLNTLWESGEAPWKVWDG